MSKRQSSETAVALPTAGQIIEESQAKLASMRDQILDTLAQRVASKQRIPVELTLSGLSIPTLEFLSSFRADTRPVRGALARIQSDKFVGNSQTNEVAALISFYLHDQMQRTAAHKARIAQKIAA